jgi:hypothetical protein
MSSIQCANGKEINLSLFSFLHSGQTWYEKHFGFKPSSPKNAKDYEDAKNKLFENKNPLLSFTELHELQTKPCEYFADTNIAKDILSRLGLTNIMKGGWTLKFR